MVMGALATSDRDAEDDSSEVNSCNFNNGSLDLLSQACFRALAQQPPVAGNTPKIPKPELFEL